MAALKTTRIDRETGATVITIYQDNGWICEVWLYPDGTRDEIFTHSANR